MDLNPFARVVCVNLARRQDRWDEFVAGLPGDWPFGNVERYAAVDGQLCPHPPWWRQGAGAWGCYRSHLNIIEDCLNRGVASVLLLEDDAVFLPDFRARWEAYLAEVPGDWEVLYVGGQHLGASSHPPRRVSERVLVPYNVNRTHAWGLRGDGLRKVYRHLADVRDWQPGKHIDHRMGQLVSRRGVTAYAPAVWLAGQREGKSNVNGREFELPRFWQGVRTARPGLDRRHVVEEAPFVAVVGLHRSGSSCCAGVVHRLGVYMGANFSGCEPDGGYEARDLARLCERLMPFPRFPCKQTEAKVRDQLAGWVRRQQRVAGRAGTVAGGKYPHLCAMGHHLHAMLGENLYVVHIDRPLEESVASLVRRSGRRHDALKLEALQRYLWDEKQAFLGTPGLRVLDVEYSSMLDDPLATAVRIASFLPLEAAGGRVQAAAAYVKPEMQHVRM